MNLNPYSFLVYSGEKENKTSSPLSIKTSLTAPPDTTMGHLGVLPPSWPGLGCPLESEASLLFLQALPLGSARPVIWSEYNGCSLVSAALPAACPLVPIPSEVSHSPGQGYYWLQKPYVFPFHFLPLGVSPWWPLQLHFFHPSGPQKYCF